MHPRRLLPTTTAALAVLLLLAAGSGRADGFRDGVRDVLGPRFEDSARHRPRPPHPPAPGEPGVDAVRRWNRIAIDASGLDHTPVAPGESRVFGEQVGPGRSARAMAIVHIAIFDAVNAIAGGYRSYTHLPRAHPGTSFGRGGGAGGPRHPGGLVPLPGGELRRAPRRGPGRDRRSLRRRRAASRSAGARPRRSSRCGRTTAPHHPEPGMNTDYVPGDAPGVWRQDPISQSPVALGAHWGEVEPFVLRSGDQYRVAAAAGARQPRVRGRLRGGAGPRRRRRRDADPAQRRPDRDGHLLGLRRHAEPLRPAAALQPDRGPHRRPAGNRRRRRSRGCWPSSTRRWPTPASRSGTRSTTTSSGGRSPASANPIRGRARPASATAIPTPSATRTSCPSARRQAT